MSLQNRDIRGNASVSRSLRVGADATVGGSLTVGHSLRVEGWLEARHVRGVLKGLFATERSLKEAYPHPDEGWFALVGDTLPAAVWRAEAFRDSEGGSSLRWMATGESGGEFALYPEHLEAEIASLRDYAGLLEGAVGDVETFLANGIVDVGSITFDSTGKASRMTFSVLVPDGSGGETRSVRHVEMPIASAEQAGLMAGADKKWLLEAKTALAEAKEALSGLSDSVSELSEGIASEAKARADADRGLSDSISGLSDSVSEISESIASEAKARADADRGLSDSISGLSDSVSELSEGIASEAQSRADADRGLSTRIEQIGAALGGLRMMSLSEDDYAAMAESQETDPATIYLVLEEES